MFITNINEAMQKSLIGARADDPVLPDPTPRKKHHLPPKLIRTLKRPATATAVPVPASQPKC